MHKTYPVRRAEVAVRTLATEPRFVIAGEPAGTSTGVAATTIH